MSNCPYCQGSNLSEVTTTRNRPDTFKTFQCGGCSGHSVIHLSGRIYPMDKREDKESDPVSRIIDGG